MILCAGLGTRLRPLTDLRAKPLVPVGDRPALAHVLAQVGGHGARIVVNAHHRAEDIRAFAAAWRADDVRVSEERELLGTAGGLARAAKLLGPGDVLVWNGDILADVDVAALVRAHTSDATLLVSRRRGAGEGNVGIDAAGRVVRLRRDASRRGEVASADFVGVHVVGQALRARLPEKGCLVADLYKPALAAGARLNVAWYEGAWSDIGTLEEYRAANFAWLRACGERAWVAKTARVGAGVTTIESVVGAGATVDGEGELRRCVLWPGARATAPLEDAVVTP